MADSYSANQGWTLQATGDTNWGQVLNAIFQSIDALGAIGPLAVKTLEQPTSQSLYVVISAGVFEKSDGTLVSFGGNTGYAVTASATNYLWLTDAGVLTANTTGFPAGTNIVPLAIVVAGTATITSITDARRAWASFGQQSPLYAAAAANTFFAGPTSGAAATATFRTMADADLSSTHAALTNALVIFTGGFGVARRVPGSYPYTVVAGDGWVEVDSSSARTIDLPAASAFAAGQCVTILDGNGNAGTNAITIAPHGTDTINGSTSAEVISANFGWLELYSDGASNWHALAPGSGGGGYGSVTSVSNADGTLTISPTSGSVVASLNTGHANTWTVGQTIAPTSTTAIGLTINAPSGTTVPSFEVQLNGTNKLWVNSAGSVCVGSAALATTATDGFLYVPTCSGVPTGAATAETGLTPLIVDSADGRLYAYISGSWENLTPSVGSISINTTTVTSGTSGYILYCNGTAVGAEQFVPPAHGGTGFDGSAAANGAIPIGNGTGFSLATLTQGSGITITNSPGGITIAATAGGAVITVGSTSVTSGTSGELLYDNAGTLGQLAATSSQGVTLTVSGGDLTVAKTALHTATDGATVTFDLSVSDLHIETLGGNRTLALANVTVGLPFTIVLVQDGTGSRTVTWWSGIRWSGGTTPTLATGAGKADTFTFLCIGAGSYLGALAIPNA